MRRDVTQFVWRVTRLADLSTVGAHDLGINVGRVDLKGANSKNLVAASADKT